MRKWILALAFTLGLFLLPGTALAGMRATLVQSSPDYVCDHGETISIRPTIYFDDERDRNGDGKVDIQDQFRVVFEVKNPDGAIIYSDSYTGFDAALLGKPWTIRNAPETSQHFTLTVHAYGYDSGSGTHSILVYSSSNTHYQIQISHNSRTDWITTVEPTCTAEGTRIKRCTVCNAVVQTEQIPETGHHYTWVIIPATCTTPILRREVCTVCGHPRNVLRGFGYAPHTPGEWQVTVPATETETGTQTQYCTVCGTVVGTQSIPPTGLSEHSHTLGQPVITQAATCAEDGLETVCCTECGEVISTRVLPATGNHAPSGSWTHVLGTEGANSYHSGACSVCGTQVAESCSFADTVTPATCTQAGYTTHTCTLCGYSYTDGAVTPTGHIHSGSWAHVTGTDGADSHHTGACSICGAQIDNGCSFTDTLTPPTCTQAGYTTHTCTLCGYTYADSASAATGHTPGEWETVKAATNKSKGLKAHRCAVCGEVLQSLEIPVLSQWWRNNTACALGKRARDEMPALTDKWYMLTKIDLATDGVQEYPLIASNAYIIGKVHVIIKGGTVAVSYDLTAKKAAVKEELLAFFDALDHMTTAEPEELLPQTVPLGEPVQIEKLFPQKDSAYMLLWLKLDYDIYADGVSRFYEGQYQ